VDDLNVKQTLLSRGVTIVCPESVCIDSSIDPNRIAPDVVIHGGCRLSGDRTSIGPGSFLGAEAPVTLQNCQLGRDVHLKGGFFAGATMLDGVTFGSGAHVRAGTLLEEQASCAHTVGLKQTMLMPFVTLGSLINFCDCLMAGGTGPKNHSEVGSSYIHFNFTAHQDKATPSLIGDVPEGVMVDQPPIFLGGQGGLVGPTRIAYGTVVAAGTVCRRDVLERGKLVFGQTGHRVKEVSYDIRVYGEIDRICQNNFIYLGNLHALDAWYRHVRPILAANDIYAQACLEGARWQIAAMVDERIKRLTQLAGKVAASLEISGGSGNANTAGHHHQRLFVERWPDVAGRLVLPTSDDDGEAARGTFLDAVRQAAGGTYVDTIQALSSDARKQGTAWLQSISDSVVSLWGEIKNG